MKNAITTFAFCLTIAFSGFAQNVAINSTGTGPDASAMLDVASDSKGILIPRVVLTATNTASPVTGAVASLLVYNTATTGDVTPGFYYWDGTTWIKISTGSGGAVPVTNTYTSGTPTWTKPSGLKYIVVEVVGGGGSGGNTSGAGAGGGGGGGGYSRKTISAASLGTTENVTVGGGGGTSSFGSHLQASGGTNASGTSGGSGGTGSGGDLNIKGSDGSNGDSAGNSTGGQGGNSFYGGGGRAGLANNSNGSGGSQYGGGGGGAHDDGSGSQSGGGGASGVVIVTEYY